MLARPRRSIVRALAVALTSGICALWPGDATHNARAQGARLAPSSQPPAGALWLAPRADLAAERAAVARATSQFAEGEADPALPVFATLTSDPVLGGYGLLYMGRAQLAVGRHSDAAYSARQLLSVTRAGYLAEAAHWLAVDAAEANGDWPAAMRSLQSLRDLKPLAPAAVHLRLGQAAEKAGERAIALAAFNRVYYEYALTAEATVAAVELAKLITQPALPNREAFDVDLGRAQRLFGARRHADARKAFEQVRALATGDNRQLIDLRLAQCDFYLKRYAVARDALRAYIDKATSRQPEAQYFYFSTLRELGLHDEYVALARVFVDGNAQDALAETTLNELGTHYILIDDDGKAADVFAEQYRRFPLGVYADRAAWKAGWWAYKSGEFAETVRLFEAAASSLRRADYRPSWLYWAARSHLQLGHREAALAGYRQVIADYRNLYSGRQAATEIERIEAGVRPAGSGPVAPASRTLPATIVAGTPPDNWRLIQHLLAAGMHDEAIGELRMIQRDVATSPLLEATIAYALNRKGVLRPAITTMRRAYPQFMAAGGEALPREILTVIFPLEYWDLIRRYAAARRLDPYLMAALIAQESTFQADVRSSANAYGLMQVIPATGRRYAQILGIRPFSTMRLTEAETNIKIGMAYFADLLEQFGHIVPALAAYNAGEHRVVEWMAERPDLDRDEFTDDIPFPETQNYVKRVIGTAEDYRVLYKK